MARPSILFVLLLLARTAAAQTAPPALPAMDSEVRTGETLLVLTTAGVQVSGRLRSLTPDALALETRHGVETLPANRIGRIIKKDSIRNGLWIGLASGAAAGLTGGLLLNAICVNEAGSCRGAVIGLMAMGATAGAGIGAGADGLRHRTIFNALPDVRGEYEPEIAVNVGLGRHAISGLHAAQSRSAGASWSIRHSSNVGLELDVNRTIGRATRTVSCADARSEAPSRDGCVGSGREGIEDTTTGSVKAQYFFPGSRVQPYVSGGVAIFQWSTWMSTIRSRFGTRESFLFESLHRQQGLAMVAGGGVQLNVTRKISVRPDVTIYRSPGWTYARTGIGAGISW